MTDAPAVADILRGDWHIHSTFSDDARSTLAQNLDAARRAQLTEIRLIDHVRRSTTWVPDYLAAVRALPRASGLTVHTGVEAKILDASGALDVPDDLLVGGAGVDAVVIADHQFPGTDGAWSPDETRRRVHDGLAAPDALDLLIGALVSAMHSVDSAQLAHCFSILPKVGLGEDDLGDDHLRAWARAAAETGTLIEVNEKWGCPGPRALRAAISAGARLVASTDSHEASEIGRYSVVRTLLEETVAS
ncbi:MAG: histidinol-phosphatase [Frondihabitans sp.]|nr:histidinol-phosphatase [Frondihabitans sp.]